MILPHTYFAVLLLMILGAFCWGGWAGALKMARGWRFELFAFDMAFGLVAVCLLYALVFGNMGYDGFSLMDDIMHAGKHQWAYGLVGGLVFALANLFILAAVSISGLALGLTVAFGTAAIMQAIAYYFGAHVGNPLIPIGGAILAVGAIIAAASIHSSLTLQRHEALAKAGRVKSTRRPSGAKPIVLAIIGGLLMQGWRPLVQMGMTSEIGLGPYAMAVFMALGALFGTLGFGIFFIFLPVEGESLEVSSIVSGTPRQHLLGWLGGAVLATAVVARLVAVAANADPGAGGGLAAGATPVSPSLAGILGYSGPVVAALLGFAVWKELKDDARGPAHWMAAAMPILYLGGIVLISLSAGNPIIP